MKPVLAILISLLSFGLYAQSKSTPASGNCFKEWYSLFKERGAKPVTDGVQDVIITIRNGDYSECFMGKIEVTGEKLTGKLQIQKLDGSYEEFDRKLSAAYKSAEGTLKDELREVNNGMSASVSTESGESI